MPLTLPPRAVPVLDTDGLIDPRWYEFFTRFDVRLIPKAYAYVTVSGGVPTLVRSINIASITDGGVGNLGLTYERPFVTTDYTVAVTGKIGGTSARIFAYTSKAAGSITLLASDFSDVSRDPASWDFIGLGE